MSLNCSGGEGLVCDSSERFGDLNYIFCLSSGNKMNSMVDIGRGKLCWTTMRWLVKLKTLFGVEPEDGRGMNTSNRANVVSGMASNEHKEDMVLLCKREGSYDDGGWD